ncbi:MAG: hypothetical protein WEB00_15310 [Dehalococcoidia bacterium]
MEGPLDEEKFFLERSQWTLHNKTRECEDCAGDQGLFFASEGDVMDAARNVRFSICSTCLAADDLPNLLLAGNSPRTSSLV